LASKVRVGSQGWSVDLFHEVVCHGLLPQGKSTFCMHPFFCSGITQSTQLRKPHKLFSSVGKVFEIPDGSMERFTEVLQQNEFNAVLFYAPWCGQSSTAAQEFNRAAKMLYKEVDTVIQLTPDDLNPRQLEVGTNSNQN